MTYRTAHGYAPLGSDGIVPAVYLPAPSGGGGSGAPGDTRVYVDSYSGTDSSKFDQAYAYASGQAGSLNRTPPLVFSNRSWDISASTTKAPYDGMSFLSASEWGDEFRESCRVKVNPSGMFGLPNGSRSHSFQGISFESSGWWWAPFATDNSQGSMQDVFIDKCGFQVAQWIKGTFLRWAFGNIDINGCTDTAYEMGGSDSVLFGWGKNYLSGTISASHPFGKVGMSKTTHGRVYVTAQTGYGLLVYFSYGNLLINNFVCDGYGRTGTLATQQAGIQITGGTEVTLIDCEMFNTNAGGTSLGNFMTITGGQYHRIIRPRFIKQYQAQVGNVAGDALYTTVPITVDAPIAQNWATGDVKTLKQSSAGLIELINNTSVAGRTWTVH